MVSQGIVSGRRMDFSVRRCMAVLLLAALALMAGAILVNLAPPNPYSAAALAVWRQGHFLNFNGLTRWVATLWPFLTLPFLLLSSRRQ